MIRVFVVDELKSINPHGFFSCTVLYVYIKTVQKRYNFVFATVES